MPQIALDTLLAEGVMRWRRIHSSLYGTYWDPRSRITRIILNSTAHRARRWHYPEFPGHAGDGCVWSPSTNVDDAQELLAALLAVGVGVSLSLFPPGGPSHHPEPAVRTIHATGPTLTDAIVAAALKILHSQPAIQ